MWRGLLAAATEPAAAIVKLAPGARLTAGRKGSQEMELL
jgi:hypothetical protein